MFVLNPNNERTHINFKMYKRGDSQKLEKIRQHFGTLMSKHTSNRSCSNIWIQKVTCHTTSLRRGQLKLHRPACHFAVE